MTEFPYIEDYIEVLAGYRSITGNLLPFWYINEKSKFRLANYDVNIIDSLAAQMSQRQIPYTDKQRDLALLLINKYAKQFRKFNIKIPDIPVPQTRAAMREIDRSRTAVINDNRIEIRFPFETDPIGVLRKQAQSSNGKVVFNKDPTPKWVLALTDSNILWTIDFCSHYSIEVSDELKELQDECRAEAANPYAIELIKMTSGFDILNAPDSMRTYIETELGGFGLENAITLYDHAGILGYTLSPEIQDEIKRTYGELIATLIMNRTGSVAISQLQTGVVADYVKLTKRSPVVVYDPYDHLDGSSAFDGLPADECIILEGSQSIPVVPKLLLSSFSMMVGAQRRYMMAVSEKVFQFTP